MIAQWNPITYNTYVKIGVGVLSYHISHIGHTVMICGLKMAYGRSHSCAAVQRFYHRDDSPHCPCLQWKYVKLKNINLCYMQVLSIKLQNKYQFKWLCYRYHQWCFSSCAVHRTGYTPFLCSDSSMILLPWQYCTCPSTSC